MAFIDIKDPTKREETVQDYIKTLNEIRERRERNKIQGFTENRNIIRAFKPVVEATEKSAEKITNEIKNIQPTEKPVKTLTGTTSAIEYYLQNFSKSKLDTYFGIYEQNGLHYMGNKEVVIDKHNNIFLNDGTNGFKGTVGLWKLIMMKTPNLYQEEDLRNYKELLERTNAIQYPHYITDGGRPEQTAKWRFLSSIGMIPEEEEEEEFYEAPSYEEEEIPKEEEEKKFGEGIIFLPGNIKGLLDRFRLLFAEFEAGNRAAARNEIVGILDELLRRKYFKREEYNAMCKLLQC